MLARLCNPIGIRRWFERPRQALEGRRHTGPMTAATLADRAAPDFRPAQLGPGIEASGARPLNWC